MQRNVKSIEWRLLTNHDAAWPPSCSDLQSKTARPELSGIFDQNYLQLAKFQEPSEWCCCWNKICGLRAPGIRARTRLYQAPSRKPSFSAHTKFPLQGALARNLKCHLRKATAQNVSTQWSYASLLLFRFTFAVKVGSNRASSKRAYWAQGHG